MAEVQDDIMIEDIGEFQQDPKPTLPESRRRKLDSIIVQMDKQGASGDEIRAIVEDYKKRYSTKPLVTPTQPIKQEVKEFMPGVTFGGQQPQFGKNKSVIQPVDPNKPGQIAPLISRPKVITNATKAQKKLQSELHANDDVVETMIRNQRMNVAAQNFNAPTAESQATGMEQFNEPQLKPQELPVTTDEISLFKSDSEANEGAARNLFKEVTDRKPEKKKEIQSSVYLIDAVRSAGNDNSRYEKIEKNAKGIEKGELIYNITGGQLLKPEGVVGSLMTGWKQKSQLFDDFSFFNNKSDDEIIAELERRRTDYDPDEAIPVPKHKVGELSQMLGSMPVKSIVAGTATSAIGLPEAAPFVAGAVGAADFYQMGYAGTLQNVYYQLREEGKSEQEALQMARTQAQKEGAIDAVMGGAMSVAGMRIGVKPANFSPGYRVAATSFLKSAGKEGAFQSLLGAGGELSKNLLAQEAGIKRETGANVLQAIESNFLLTVGMGAAARLGKGISSVKYKSILNGLSKVNQNVLEGNIVNEVNAGRLTEDQANNIRNEVKVYKEIDSQIPENVTEEARIEIQNKIERRNKLEQELETLNKAFHPEVKEKIAKLDEEIVELSKQKEPRTKQDPQEKEVKLLIEDAIAEGVMNDVYAAVAKENPEGFMKFVADQSFGRTEEGVLHDAGGAEGQLREQLGDAIVDKAKEMFPLEEKKSSISVMMPDEVKKPDVVETKGAEAVIPETPVGDAGVPPVEGEGAKIHVERPGVELSHSGLQDVANEFSLPDVQSRDRVSDVQLRTDAEIQAKEWADKGEYAANIERLTQEAERGKVLTDKERIIMEQHLANVMGEARAIADKTSPEYASKFAEISRLKKAGEKTRSEAGAALRISGQRSLPTDSPEDMIVAKEEALGRTTTPEEKQKANQQFEKIDKAKKSLAAKGKEIADKIRALRPKTDSAQSQFFSLPIAVYDTALVAIAEAVEQGAKLADAIQEGIKYVKANGGFKDKKEEKNFAAFVKGQLTYDERLQSYKERTKTATDKLKQKTQERDFEKEPKSILELDEEAREIRKEYRKAKYEFELELQKDQLAQRSVYQKALSLLLEPFRAVRTIMTTMDFSAVLRQGIIPTIAHPDIAAKAFPEMFRQAFSKERFDEWLADIKDSPLYDVMEKSKLYISDPNTLHLSAKEENFMSNLAEKIPILRQIVKGSERAYVSYLNKMRVDLFKQGTEVFMSEGKTIENSPELYEGLANFINNATGRGKLGPLEGSAEFLNTVFFSPRLMASRANMLGLTDAFTLGQKGFYSQLPRQVRIMALKDMMKFIGFGVSVLGLSKSAGAEVEEDPRSTDFGKIKVGNTRYDIWGGFQPYVRLISQVATGQTKSTGTGEIKDLTSKKRFDRVTSFFRGKLAPVPSSVIDVMAGENIIGEPATVQSEALESITPMIISDVREAMKDQGVKALFTVGVPSIFGISSTTYDANTSKKGGDGKRPKRASKQKRPSRK